VQDKAIIVGCHNDYSAGAFYLISEFQNSGQVIFHIPQPLAQGWEIGKIFSDSLCNYTAGNPLNNIQKFLKKKSNEVIDIESNL